MTPREFISSIRQEVLDQNLEFYSQSLEQHLSTTSVNETYWPGMTELYQSLNGQQRKLFIGGLRQVMTDTLSNIFGILDGSTPLEKHRNYFHLTYGDSALELNGELQDLFLSESERDVK